MEITKRKLKFTEVMIISKILKRINIKSYIEYLCSNKIDKMLKSMSSKFEINENELLTETERLDKLAKIEAEKIKEIQDKQKILAIDVISFVFQNIGEADDLFMSLFASYLNKPEEDIKNIDIDDMISIFKVMFTEGLPGVITSLIDLTQLKKKLNLMNSMN